MVLNARRAQNVPKNHEVILGFCSHAIHACHHQEAHIATTYQLHADDNRYSQSDQTTQPRAFLSYNNYETRKVWNF
jgi:hypothetical protein